MELAALKKLRVLMAESSMGSELKAIFCVCRRVVISFCGENNVSAERETEEEQKGAEEENDCRARTGREEPAAQRLFC